MSNIKTAVSSTFRKGTIGGIGGFGGLFDVKAAGYKNPILSSGTDGVGTKLKVMYLSGRIIDSLLIINNILELGDFRSLSNITSMIQLE